MQFFKKAFIGIGLGSFLFILSGIGLIKLDQAMSSKARTFREDILVSMDSRKLVYQPQLIAPYKTMDIFMSDVKESDFAFTGVGMSWEEILPEGTHIELEIKTREEDGWSEWIQTEEEEDPFNDHEDFAEKKYGMLNTAPAEKMQYRFLLYGDGKSSPIAKNVDYTFLRAGQSISLKAAPRPRQSSFDGGGILALVAGPAGVISRSQWGADESYRYLKDQSIEAQLVDVDPEWYEKYKDELQYSRVVEADEDGKKYRWPLQYPQKVKKFIIHHTATTSNLNNPAQAIRDIYYYHAVTRGWGDIGYNYIVDREGNIYEGRYGGERVIGAHSGPGNHGSIGVAILGNYENEPAPENVIVQLSKFIYKKSLMHGILAEGFSDFRGESMPNIFGHRDIMPTQCPGEYLYEKIPILRKLAAASFEEKEKFVKDYDYQNKSSVYYIELMPEETRELTIQLENIGKLDWNDDTYIVVDDNPDFDGILSFPTKKDVILAPMQESLTKSGQTATFKFQLEGGRKGKTVYMNIAPLFNGTKKPFDYVVLPVTVQQPVYKYEFLDAQFPPPVFKAGETFTGSVRVKNAGNMAWEDSGDFEVILESDNDGIIGKLSKSKVAPNETASFNFTFTAPEKAGYQKYTFTPQIKDGKFTGNANIAFETVIYNREFDAEILSKNFETEWQRGTSNNVSLKLRNIGIENWGKDKLKLFILREPDIRLNGLSINPQTVKPGEQATISFTVKVTEDAELAEKMLIVRAKMSGNALNFVPAVYKYKIVEKKFYSEDQNGPPFRVKLGFNGDPEVTANGSFEIFSGSNLLTTLNAGEIAKVTKESDSYRVTASGTNFVKTEPIRFVPKSGAILQITNFEHRPSWNPKLNDNEYRGILEVREDDGSLIVINELPIEYYLKGLGEVSNDEEAEKIKAIITAARTYALFYLEKDEKFPGKPYNLDDNPDVSQKYLGYGFEKRAPNVAQAIDDTKGKVITYNAEVVKTPYFNQSDGTKTKSAQEVWGWTNTPYLLSVSDSFCDGDKFLGHGVGMSGCGAHGMAAEGYGFEEILKHYYTGVEIIATY